MFNTRNNEECVPKPNTAKFKTEIVDFFENIRIM